LDYHDEEEVGYICDEDQGVQQQADDLTET